MMNVLIRPAEISDFDAVFELLKQLWPNNHLDFDRMKSVFFKNLNSSYKRLRCAEFENKIIGFCSLTLTDNLWQQGLLGNVDELVVDEKLRSKGIGKLLMNDITNIAKEEGCEQIELDSSLHRIQAHQFYLNLGFKSRAYLFSKSLKN